MAEIRSHYLSHCTELSDSSRDGVFDADRVSFRYAGAAPEGVVRLLFRERRANFCAFSHCVRAVSKGRVTVDGVTASVGTRVSPGQSVCFLPTHVVRICTDADGVARRKVIYCERVEVVMESDQWAVVIKPAGLVMDTAAAKSWKGAKASLRTLAAILPYSLQPSAAADALPVPAAVHRLDAPVGGLVACAKSRAAARRLEQLFRARAVQKTYVAIVAGTPCEAEGELREPVGGKISHSSYRVLRSQPSLKFGALTTLELRPHTGRTHQLRRHCAEALQCPIVGDVAYGGERVQAGQALYLWAVKLELGGDGGEDGGMPTAACAAAAEHSDGEEEEEVWRQASEGDCDSGEPGEAGAIAELNGQLHRGACFETSLPSKFGKLLLRDQRAWALRPPPPLSPQPMLARRCVVFDFDETLAVGCGAADSDTTQLFGGVERMAALSALLTWLVSGGITLAISSSNTRSVTEAQLRAAGMLDFFAAELIFGREICLQGRSRGKGDVCRERILATLAPPAEGETEFEAEGACFAHFGPTSADVPRHAVPQPSVVEASEDGSSSVLFVDDLADNLLDVRRKCACVATLLVDDYAGRGMQAAEFGAIRTWAREEPVGEQAEHVAADVQVVQAG